jgi:hypothetical protein
MEKSHRDVEKRREDRFDMIANDEARMPNDEGMTKSETFGRSSFGFHSSFVIGHSSF